MLVLFMTAQGQATAITNGTPDNGRHPFAGAIDLWSADQEVAENHKGFCSASLLSPTLVLTAGHCTVGVDHAYFAYGESLTDPNLKVYRGKPFTYPGMCVGKECGTGRTWVPGDVGVFVLDTPVPASEVSTYAALPAAGVVDTLPNKTPLEVVGYGWEGRCHTTDLHPAGQFFCSTFTRKAATTELVSGEFNGSDQALRFAMNPGGGSGGTCFGDSGGPNVKVGSNVVLAVNSHLSNDQCTGVGYSQRIDKQEILDWIKGPHQ
jgi:secreted trypsin-like serine protease